MSFTKNKAKNLSAKYSQKLLDNTKQCSTDVRKTVLKREIQKTAETTSDLIGNKIKSLMKLQKSSRISPQNSLETAKNEHDK